MNKETKRRIAYEVLLFLGLMALLCFLTRIWVILFLIILGIFIAALRLLFLSSAKVEIVETATVIPEEPPRPDTEQDVLKRAYAVIGRRITEQVKAQYPGARWVWSAPNALAHIAEDEPVTILLNGAGGYRKVLVQVHNLQFCGLKYETSDEPDEKDLDPADVPKDETDQNEETNEESEKINYGYLAFEWVEANLFSLNERSNEAIGQGNTSLLIPSGELPDVASWQDICTELVRGGFPEASVMEDGIRVKLPQSHAERK